MVDAQGRENNRIDVDVAALQEENRTLRSTIATLQHHMDQMATSIQQLQGQVFGNYDSDSDGVESRKSIAKLRQQEEHQRYGRGQARANLINLSAYIQFLRSIVTRASHF